MKPKIVCVRLRIYGKVQGVYFRHYARLKAEELGVSGWVRNCRDGSVEMLVCGDPTQVEAMKLWAHKGSPHASVRRVEVQSLAASGCPSDFTIRY